MDAGNLEGLIPLCGGIFGLYMFIGPLPKEQEKREKAEQTRKKLGSVPQFLFSGTIVFGLLQLFGVLG